jgi:lysine-N-methylase
MPVPPLTLPTIQNWSCHNCSGCCKQHLIELSEEERQRIVDQEWTSTDGIPAGQPVLEPHAGPPWKKRYRLAHRDDGACVFLNDDGLCRIHAKFGEAAKPLACRIYPYAFHPAGKKVTVSLRFSCPSVVSNRGKQVSQNRDELKQIARLVVPENADRMGPPKVSSTESLDWPDILKLVATLDSVIANETGRFIERLLQSLFIVDLLGQAKFDLIRGERLTELLQIVVSASGDESPPVPIQPGRLALMQFRQLVANYARRDTVADLRGGLRNRWKLLRAAMKFTSGTGLIPALQDCFREVPFDSIEHSFGGIPPEIDEILTRYLRVKLQGLHFCGPAYFTVPFVEGFQSLALIVPSICWIARWLALSNDRQQWVVSDFEQAIAIADHHHGYSAAFATIGFRNRVRTLAKTGELTRLVVWYST